MDQIKQKLKNWLNKLHDPGIKFPMACDTQHDVPSSTLFFTYLSFLIAYASVIVLIMTNPLYGAIGAGGLYILSLVFYLMRRVSVFRVDINDGELELNSEPQQHPEKGKRIKHD